MQSQKEQKTDNKQNINENLPENALEAVEPYFGPQNMFDCSFAEHDNVLCGHSLIKISNNWTEKKKKCKNYVILVFEYFSKKFFFQSHESH